MNPLKLLYTALLICFITNVKAQINSTEIDNIADITLSVTDVLGRQLYSLDTEAIQYFDNGQNYSFKLSLNYTSEIDSIAYFRMEYFFIPIYPDGTTINTIPVRGTTAPVIIPPVKKSLASEYRPIGNDYPYTVLNLVPLFPRNYKVVIQLRQYETYEGYISGIGNSTEGPELVYILRGSRMPNLNGSPNVFRTFPNPTVNEVTITTARENHNSETTETPIQLTIYDKNGIEKRSETLHNAFVKDNQNAYTISMSDLPKGMYFFELTKGNIKTVKRIVKN